MKEKDFIILAETYVLNSEAKRLDHLWEKYSNAQTAGNDEEMDDLLEKIRAEKDRIDTKDKFDEEEYIIGKIVRGR